MSIDDERREVAERLREQAYVRHDSPGEAFVAIREAIKNEDMIQNWHGESRRERQVFIRLASLIDPPGAECASACGVDLARLMLAHPDLPVLKLHTEADEDDNYVLKLTRARLGTWWLADARVWDDYEDACHALGDDWTTDDEDMAIAPDDIPHGRIWVDMDYA